MLKKNVKSPEQTQLQLERDYWELEARRQKRVETLVQIVAFGFCAGGLAVALAVVYA